MSINVKRFINRETGHFSVEVLTPMFLGGADGNAELRSPPLKNALRYWWRITQGDTPKDKLLEKEQKLFGGVNDEASRSLVDIVVIEKNIKLEEKGSEIYIGKKPNKEADGKSVSLAAYLGLGPIHFKGIYEKKPISPGSNFNLSIIYPKEEDNKIIDAISLFAHFGNLGSRSRNGWGSINIKSLSPTIKLLTFSSLYTKYGEEINKIFGYDKKYPVRLGTSPKNEKQAPLLWKIASDKTWKIAMQEAASKYMDIRHSLTFGRPKGRVDKRHILGYPVMNHEVHEWDEKSKSDGRMPSQLRILVRKKGEIYTSYFFHLPHLIPKKWDKSLNIEELSLWKQVHKTLDEKCERMDDMCQLIIC
ncbi:MAG: type III-B CRISPR module RAMP protein Cmr1 [Desulfamplus sp.]